MSDITETYLNKVYEELQAEQMRLMNEIKTGSAAAACASSAEKERDITKQITLINGLLLNLLRLRNCRKVVAQRLNSA